jgi:hypothetical protein
MPQKENADRARAERLFKTREQQKADAPKATTDYCATEQAVRDRTQELSDCGSRATSKRIAIWPASRLGLVEVMPARI